MANLICNAQSLANEIIKTDLISDLFHFEASKVSKYWKSNMILLFKNLIIKEAQINDKDLLKIVDFLCETFNIMESEGFSLENAIEGLYQIVENSENEDLKQYIFKSIKSDIFLLIIEKNYNIEDSIEFFFNFAFCYSVWLSKSSSKNYFLYDFAQACLKLIDKNKNLKYIKETLKLMQKIIEEKGYPFIKFLLEDQKFYNFIFFLSHNKDEINAYTNMFYIYFCNQVSKFPDLLDTLIDSEFIHHILERINNLEMENQDSIYGYLVTFFNILEENLKNRKFINLLLKASRYTKLNDKMSQIASQHSGNPTIIEIANLIIDRINKLFKSIE